MATDVTSPRAESRSDSGIERVFVLASQGLDAGGPVPLRRLGETLGLGLGRAGDQVRQLGDGGQIAALRQPSQAERVQRVAGEETEVLVHSLERPRAPVVEL